MFSLVGDILRVKEAEPVEVAVSVVKATALEAESLATVPKERFPFPSVISA